MGHDREVVYWLSMKSVLCGPFVGYTPGQSFAVPPGFDRRFPLDWPPDICFLRKAGSRCALGLVCIRNGQDRELSVVFGQSLNGPREKKRVIKGTEITWNRGAPYRIFNAEREESHLGPRSHIGVPRHKSMLCPYVARYKK